MGYTLDALPSSRRQGRLRKITESIDRRVETSLRVRDRADDSKWTDSSAQRRRRHSQRESSLRGHHAHVDDEADAGNE